MNGRQRKFLVFIFGFGAGSALLLALLLPSLISALPGQVRGRLPDEVLRAVTTPLPTALPAPIHAAVGTPIPLGQLLPATNTVATPVDTITAAVPTSTPPATMTGTPAFLETEYCPYPAGGCDTAVVPAIPGSEEADTATPAATASHTAAVTVTSTPTTTATATPSPPPLAQEVQINGLVIVPQKFNNCGPANMSVVLNYYGAPDTQIDISRQIKPHYDDRNVTPEDLVAYVNMQTGLQAAVFRGGDIDLLRALLQAGYPVIVEKGYEPDAWQGWMGHYLTLTGYDDQAQEFTSLDTYLGPWDSSGRPVSYDELAFRWEQFNNAFLVVYRPIEEEEVLELVGPALTDHSLMWQNAAAAAETALVARPEDAFVWFNLGASLTELAKLNGDEVLYSAAAAAFDQSRIIGLPPRMMWYQFQPYEAYINSGRIDEALALASAVMQNDGGRHVEESHFYQGAAYETGGRPDLARSAYKRALDIKPGYQDAQQALDDLAAN